MPLKLFTAEAGASERVHTIFKMASLEAVPPEVLVREILLPLGSVKSIMVAGSSCKALWRVQDQVRQPAAIGLSSGFFEFGFGSGSRFYLTAARSGGSQRVTHAFWCRRLHCCGPPVSNAAVTGYRMRPRGTANFARHSANASSYRSVSSLTVGIIDALLSVCHLAHAKLFEPRVG